MGDHSAEDVALLDKASAHTFSTPGTCPADSRILRGEAKRNSFSEVVCRRIGLANPVWEIQWSDTMLSI